ncbi:MAG: alanine-phosphoribitol ligase [Xanthomonadales bacterium]|nr:alanine-phosphoribitol ligase [Xanthomonadales bacterium]|tara:strand:+ start:2227 stop:3120 length:894 start_codon:yes stop_codon:yes gene_type:complete
MNTFIVTGGNRGLGFEIARHLAEDPGARVVLAVRSMDRGQDAARRIGSNVEAMELDLASRDSVDSFIENWDGPIAGLVNNAGVQFADATHFTDDGIEETFAVNHLNALRLTLGLENALQGGRVMFIGSGTHNPRHPTAAPFGFRGEQYESIRNCAEGLDSSDKMGQLGKDRYATTKFLNMVTTVELARRYDANRILFICLDPGLMPGTDLARTVPGFLKFGWYYVLPIIARVLPDSSTPERSGEAGAKLLTEDRASLHPGGIYTYECKLSERVIDRVFDPEIGRRVLDHSMAMLRSG